jgi:small subunit ribosomal protein S7
MAYKKFTASEDMLKPDPRFNSKLVSKFINCLMWQGKKTVAMKVFYTAMEQIAKKGKDKEGAPQPLEVFEGAINNVKPYVEVRSKRVGGANYQVPTQVNYKRQTTLAIRWVLAAVRSRKGRGIAVALADEFAAAYKREGTAMTTRENVHKMADANKAFAHFAW